MMTKFEWGDTKAKRNIRKHHTSFETAVRVFSDPFAITEQDHVEDGELRWKTLGVSDGYLLLLVVHTIRENDDVEIIRIISARRADRKERKRYEQNRSLRG